jgi:P-type Cu+ transporter
VTHVLNTISAVQLFGAWSIDSGAALLILITAFAAAMIERQARSRTAHKLASLKKLQPHSVRIARQGRESFDSREALESGQVFVVRAGERFPTDGIVEEGSSQVDESVWTGDPSPRAKEPGEMITAGTLNLENTLQVRATHKGSESTLTRSITILEQAFSSRLGLDGWVDYANRLVFPGIVLAALGIFLVYWCSGLGTFQDSFLRGVAIALVAYPLAIRLATRPVINAALWAASREGILVRDARVFETLERVNHVFLDKTGTITDGNFELLGCELVPDYCSSPAWMQANAANPDADSLPSDFPFTLGAPSYEQTFELLGSTEQHSAHPLGLALVNFACERGIPLEEATCTEVHKGLGVTGIVEGRSMFVGGRRLVEGLCIFVDARTELVARRWESEGRTVVFFGWDGSLRGCLAFGDKPRQHAAELIATLKHRGIRAHLLSGDSTATTEALARQLGAESCRSDLLPGDKADLIRGFRKRGAIVAMAGHPIDDSPALASADASIAIGSANDWGPDTPSVILMDEDLTKISKVIDLAKKTMRTVRQNLLWASSCTAAGVALAVSGIINPFFAALLVLASGLGVVGNSIRLESAVHAQLKREL